MNISCDDNNDIDINDVEIWAPVIDSHNCNESKKMCNLAEPMKSDIKKNCNGATSCERNVDIDADCSENHKLAFYSASYLSNKGK